MRRPTRCRGFGCSLAVAFVSACSSPAAEEGTSGTDGQGTDNSVEQSAQCDAYLRCVAELTPESFGSLLDAYGPSGTCWEDPEVAQLCTETCESSLMTLEDAFGEGSCEGAADTASTGPSDSTGTGDPGGPVELDLGDVACIELGTHQLRDFVVSGDPDVLACEVESGSGAGRLPEELSVESDCWFTGRLADDRVGGWAAMVRVEQPAGPDVHIPFCASTPNYADSGVQISPTPVMTGQFSPGDPVAFGGADAPRFEITAPVGLCTPPTCLYGYTFRLTGSEFDLGTTDLDDELLVEGGDPVGMAHGFSLSGPAVSSEFEARAWVQSVELDYCFGTESDKPCMDPAAASAFAVVMRPVE